MHLCVPDDVKATDDIAMVGSDFLKDIWPALMALKTSEILQKKRHCIQYIFKFYNVKGFIANLAVKGLLKIVNPFIEALNEMYHLPKYNLILPDKDLITALSANRFDASYVMGTSLHYIIHQIDMFINRCKMELLDKKPGALVPEHPKIIWVRMLKRPKRLYPHKMQEAVTH